MRMPTQLSRFLAYDNSLNTTDTGGAATNVGAVVGLTFLFLVRIPRMHTIPSHSPLHPTRPICNLTPPLELLCAQIIFGTVGYAGFYFYIQRLRSMGSPQADAYSRLDPDGVNSVVCSHVSVCVIVI